MYSRAVASGKLATEDLPPFNLLTASVLIYLAPLLNGSWEVKEQMFLDLFSSFLGIAAVVMSAAALYLSRQAHNDLARASVVENEYSAFDELGVLRLQYWQVAHLFELSVNYPQISSQIRSVVGVLGPDNRQEHLLKERAIAVRILEVYEKTFYHRNHAANIKLTTD